MAHLDCCATCPVAAGWVNDDRHLVAHCRLVEAAVAVDRSQVRSSHQRRRGVASDRRAELDVFSAHDPREPARSVQEAAMRAPRAP